MPDDAIRDDAMQALSALDTAIAAAPHRDGTAFSNAVIHLSAARDALAREGRGTQTARERLTRINAILSLILAGHFPLGSPPWDEIAKARDWLDQLIKAL